jgi:tetratricopeptide (TPR) repeat protein
MTEAGVIVYYLRLCFWPHPLVIDYFDWPIVRSLRDALLPGLVVVGLLGATVWAFRRRPWLGFLGAWFFLILAPTSSFLPSAGEMIAERRMYSPLAAVITLVVVGVFVLGRRLWNKRQGTALGCVGTACVVMVFGFLTIQRNRDYRSALAIWGDTVEKRPGNPRAHNNLGLAFAKLGRLDDAEGQYEQALRIKPDLADAQFNWGLALVRQGRVPEAIGHWEQALRIKPDFADAQYNLGLAFAQQGRLQEAISHWEKALRIDPNIADAQYNWGLALEKLGRSAEAIPHYREALRTQPDLGQARDALARLEIRQ